jgi:CelD/BcsL family acetyltransferase involved in cellulose biosynthesis
VLAADPASARLLGHAYWEALRARDRAVLTALGPVPAQDSALADLAAGFPGAEVVSGNAVPVVERQQSALATDYLSASMRRTLRKAANRSHSDGVRTTIGFVRDHDEIAALLPALEQLHRDRDHDQGRPSELDDPHDAAVWRSRLLALNEAGQLEVATLHIDSELAAHVIGVVDGDTYRVLEGVLASRFARYSPGRVLETAVLQHVLDQPELHTLDWVSSIASETLLAVSSALPTSVLRAALAAPGASTQPG